MPSIIAIITLLLAISAFCSGVVVLWYVRKGMFARTLVPFVISWVMASLIALVELIDTTPRGEYYGDILQILRISMSLLGTYFLWKIVTPRTSMMRVKKS